MGYFQTFEWIIDEDEAFYFFRVINIANELGSRFAVAKTANDDASRLKLAVEYDSLATLEAFKDRVCHRMTFQNWQYLSDRHFLYEAWLFVPNENQARLLAHVRYLLEGIANYSFGFPDPRIIRLFPYNMDTFRNSIGRLEEFDDLKQRITKAQIPSTSEIESVIQNFLSSDTNVTYFYGANYWDAKVTTNQGAAILDVISLEEDDYASFCWRGNLHIVLTVTQHLANEFGSMVLDNLHNDWTGVVVNPTDNQNKLNLYFLGLTQMERLLKIAYTRPIAELELTSYIIQLLKPYGYGLVGDVLGMFALGRRKSLLSVRGVTELDVQEMERAVSNWTSKYS